MRVLLFTLAIIAFTANAQAKRPCDDLDSDVRVGKWEAVQESANKARLAICNYVFLPTSTSQNFMRQDIEYFVTTIILQQTFSDQQVQKTVNEWLSKLDDSPTSYFFPVFASNTFNDQGIDFYLYEGDKHLSTVSLSQEDIDRCQCEALLDDLGQMIGDVYYAGAKAQTHKIIQITQTNAQWKSFLKEAREQTYFDIAATTAINRYFFGGNDGNDFDTPPTVQWFFMRPNVVVENVGAAFDGQEIKEAAAIEVIGFNLWQDKSCLGLFSCGFSGTLNYADRAGVDSHGWGIMMHIENAYSIGFSKYGGDAGFYVTIDLLNLFKDKKSTFDRYTKRD